MQVLSWNVDGTFPPQGSPDTIDDQVGWLASRERPPDVLLLQEVNPNRRALWLESLTERLGYHTTSDTLELALEHDNSNGHVTAVRGDIDIVGTTTGSELNPVTFPDGTERQTRFPEKLLITEIEQEGTMTEVWNVRAVPGNQYPEEKIAILEMVYAGIATAEQRPRILAGI